MSMSQHKISNTNHKVIIIGTGVAGMNVAYQLMKSDKPFKITCITHESICDYSTCGIPYVLEGEVNSFEDIILHKPEFFSDKNVQLLKSTEVIDLDFEKNQVKIKQSLTGKEVQEKTLDYEYLVLATGRLPMQPPISGLDLAHVHTLMNYEDGQKLDTAMRKSKTAVIIGGGIIGLEVAVACRVKKIDTTVVELAPLLLPTILDSDMSNLVQDWLMDKGIKILTGRKVETITNTKNVNRIILDDGTELISDLIILTAGIKPNTELAEKTGLALGPTGGIKTDYTQCVIKDGARIANEFALGDCVESRNHITKQPMLSALASTAILQARVVAGNILGTKSEMSGVVNPTITLLAGLQVGSVGLTSHAAELSDLKINTATSFGKSRSRYYPGWKNIYFKFLASNGKLIGAQIIGEEDVKERINAITIVIKEGISIESLMNIERCYTPPLVLLTDPMLKVLNQLI